MAVDVDALKAHLQFFAELGVDGMRLDRLWRARNHAPAAGLMARREGDLPAEEAAHTSPSHAPTGARAERESLERENPEHENPEPPNAEPQNGEPQNGEHGNLEHGTGNQEPVPSPLFASPADALLALRADVGDDCSRCKLHSLGRRQVVFGVGNPQADLMFVGEAPGADEDVQGEPFVGRAGQLLTKIIEAIGLRREDVYIANVIKCRPPGNRNPEPDEVDQCEPFLFRQIDIVKPKVIVALGKFAAQCLLKTDAPITRIRGREFAYRDAVLIPTYHPAYLLRTPSAKRDVWEDMKRVRAILADDTK